MMPVGMILARLALGAALMGAAWSTAPLRAQDQGASGSTAPPPLSELEPDPPDMPQEPGPPLYAPQEDPMCGRLAHLLRRHMPPAERRKAAATHRALHCPALAASGSSRPHPRKKRHSR